EYFHPKYEPFGDHAGSQQRQHPISHITGPFSWMNPTRVLATPPTLDGAQHWSPSELASNNEARHCHESVVTGEIKFHWRTRDNRKGRHALQIIPVGESAKGHIVPLQSSSWRSTLKGIHRMVTAF